MGTAPVAGVSITMFECPDKRENWDQDIKSSQIILDQEMRITYAFCRLICAHPLSDGNGRFSRSYVSRELGKVFGWEAPLVPLTPAFYFYKNEINDGLVRLSDAQDASIIHTALWSAIRMAADWCSWFYVENR